MADTMQFDLVSPERSLASLQASAVQLPGSEGDMTAMPDHTPVLTTLRPGVVRVTSPEGDAEFVVTGGFAEVTATSTSVLAEKAVPRADITQEVYDAMIAEARAAHEAVKSAVNNEPGPVDDAARLLSDMVALGDHIGLMPSAG